MAKKYGKHSKGYKTGKVGILQQFKAKRKLRKMGHKV